MNLNMTAVKILNFVTYKQHHKLHCVSEKMHQLWNGTVQNYKKTGTETRKLYSRVFRIFFPNIIKIVPYNFELYRFKVSAFLRHSV